MISPTNTCNLNLVLTNYPYGTWWEGIGSACGGNVKHKFNENESITITGGCAWFPLEPFAYSTDNNDTVLLYPFAFISDFELYLSTSNTKENKNYKVYPNPVNNKLYIEMKDEIMSNAVVIDISGKKLNVIVQNNSINFEALPSGVYFLQFKNRNGDTFTEKLVKM